MIQKRYIVMSAFILSLAALLLMLVYVFYSTLILAFNPLAFFFYLVLLFFLIVAPVLGSLRMPVSGGILMMLIGAALLISFSAGAKSSVFKYGGLLSGGMLFLAGILFVISNFFGEQYEFKRKE